jgi:hypothetical protein
MQLVMENALLSEKFHLTPSGEKPPPYTVWGLVTRNNGVASKTYSNVVRLSLAATLKHLSSQDAMFFADTGTPVPSTHG